MARHIFNILRRRNGLQIEAESAPQDTCVYLMAAGAQMAAFRGTIPELGEAPRITKPADPATVINALSKRLEGGDPRVTLKRTGARSARYFRSATCQLAADRAIHSSTRRSRIESGCEPEAISRSWKPLMSNLLPSVFSARARSSMILSIPIL